MEMPYAYREDCDCDFCSRLRREAREEEAKLAHKADREERFTDRVIEQANQRERT